MRKKTFRKTVVQHKDLVYNRAFYFTKNGDDAADITQDVFLALWSHRDKVNESAVKGWLMVATKNKCIDFFRKKREVSYHRFEDEWGKSLEPQAQQPDPEQVAMQYDMRSLIAQGLQEIKPTVRMVLILREIEQRSYDEIASIMEMPINTVKVYIHRGRKQLFEYLKEFLALQTNNIQSPRQEGRLKV